jgi:hypothetical protein
MQTPDPALMSALAALSAAVLMVHAGVGKRLLTWRPHAAPRRQPRKPPRNDRSGFPGGRR